MSAPAVAIVYEGETRLVALTTIKDRALLLHVAAAALRIAADKATTEKDAGLAEINRQEAIRLWRTLRWFIPELVVPEGTPMVM